MTIGKKNSTLRKSTPKESKLLATGVKSVKFWHEATAGETSITFGSLVLPADILSSGLTNPTSTEILAANLQIFHNNVEVHSSLNQKLMEGLTYVVKNSQIKFVNGYEATEGEIFEVNYKNDVITGTNVVDARPLTATGTLTAGNVDFNTGEVYKTNAYPATQMGEVTVFVDGVQQYRNVANATATPLADGNYEEVHAVDGFGTIIRFNDVFGVDKAVTVISRGLIAERPDISVLQLIENLGGQLDAVIETTADLAGVPESTFQVAPNQVDLKVFGDKVTAIEEKTILAPVIVRDVYSGLVNGSTTANTYSDANVSVSLTVGIWDIECSAPLYIQGGNGASLSGRIGKIGLFNSSNVGQDDLDGGTNIRAIGSGVCNAATNTIVSTITMKGVLEVTSNETFKVRFTTFENSALTSITNLALYGSHSPIVLKATKRVDDTKIKDLI